MSVLILNPQYRLQFEVAQDSHVLLFPEGMVQLNEAASTILLALDSGKTEPQLVAELQQRFPDAAGLAADVSEFLQIGLEKSWVVWPHETADSIMVIGRVNLCLSTAMCILFQPGRLPALQKKRTHYC
jgi:pyrroloquinoline quinone biosynthesis protein D